MVPEEEHKVKACTELKHSIFKYLMKDSSIKGRLVYNKIEQGVITLRTKPENQGVEVLRE